MGELEKLDKDTKEAVSRVAAEYKYAKDLQEQLETIEGEKDPKKADKEVKNAIRILRWIGKAERRVDQSERKIIANLEDLGKMLPEDLKSQDEQLANKLKVIEAKLVSLASMFTGKVKKELGDIKTDEALLKRYESDTSKAEDIRMHLLKLLRETEGNVHELIEWIKSAEALLSQIQGFEQTLKKITA